MLLGTIGVLSVAMAAVICAVADGFSGLAWLWILPAGFIGSFLGWALLAFLLLWFFCAVVRLLISKTLRSGPSGRAGCRSNLETRRAPC